MYSIYTENLDCIRHSLDQVLNHLNAAIDTARETQENGTVDNTDEFFTMLEIAHRLRRARADLKETSSLIRTELHNQDAD